MISKEQARELIEEHLKLCSSEESGVQLAIMDDATVDCGFGWVFFYNSKEFLDSKDFRDMLAGNAPIIVDKTDGSLHVTGTAKPVQYYIHNYERLGTPHPPAPETG